MLHIDPSLRRRGVGSLVVRHLANEILSLPPTDSAALAAKRDKDVRELLEEGPDIVAYTDLENTAGNKLFEHLGFKAHASNEERCHWGRYVLQNHKIEEEQTQDSREDLEE